MLFYFIFVMIQHCVFRYLRSVLIQTVTKAIVQFGEIEPKNCCRDAGFINSIELMGGHLVYRSRER